MRSIELTSVGDDHGLMTLAHAHEVLGAHDTELWRRRRWLVPVQPGVYRLATTDLSWLQQLQAAVLASSGVVSHRAAGELWGLVEPAGWVEVSAPERPRTPLRPPAVLHLGDRRAEERAGLPVTDPLETLCDLAQTLPNWALNAALNAALGTRLVSIHAVEHLRSGHVSRREEDVAALRTALRPRRLPCTDAEADHADRVARVLTNPELDLPRLWLEVWEDGRFVARPEAANPARRLALVVEHGALDGDDWKAIPDIRAQRLRDAGWQVIRASAYELRHHPDRLSERIIEETRWPRRRRRPDSPRLTAASARRAAYRGGRPPSRSLSRGWLVS